MKYYYLTSKTSNTSLTLGYKDKVAYSQQLVEDVWDRKKFLEFQWERVRKIPGDFEFIPVINLVREEWPHFPPNTIGNIASPELKRVIESNFLGDEIIRWLPCKITSGSITDEYFIVAIEKFPETLNEEKSVYIKETGRLFSPVFSAKAIEKMSIFTAPHFSWQIPSALVVSEDLKKQLSKSFPELKFEKASVDL